MPPGQRRLADDGPAAPVRLSRQRSRIAQAREYHPRGQTVAESAAARGAADSAAAQSAAESAAAASRTSAARAANRTASRTASRTAAARAASRTATAGAANRTAARAASRTATGRAASRTAAARTASSTTSRTTAARLRSRGGGSRPEGVHLRLAGGRDVTRSAVVPPLANQPRRLRVATTLILVLFVVLAGRLVQFQLTDAPAYAARGLTLRLQPVDLPAPRGSILDRSGAVLAGSAEARYVFADPELVKDPIATAARLSPLLGIPRSELIPKLVKHRHPNGEPVRFEYLARGLPIDAGERVSELGLDGIGVRRDESRVVPGHDLAANLIGFTGRDLGGLAGLEASFDHVLRGVDGRRVFEIGQPDGDIDLDREIPGGYHEETPARPGSSLRLTLDRDLQFEVQRILGANMAKVGAMNGAAIVLDARTGEILAQASYPFYDAANPLASRPEDRGDMATGMAIDPGSVHKAIVVAACLQEGVVMPGDSIVVAPSVTKGGTRYTDTHPMREPTAMTLPGILAWSSNVGTIELADRLGAQKLYEYQRAFGLGQPTGAGLPGEAAGLVQPPENWSAESAGSIPIGLGVSVTPLQMTAVYAAIANGGVWVQPHLVQAIINADGTETPVPVAPGRRVISADNAAALRTMLEGVVTLPQATGRTAAVDGYRVAGKTGTGRVVKDGKYAPGEVASFIGMAPADAPRYVIGVFAYTPGGNGGEVAGPAFADMMEFTLRHYGIAPTRSEPPRLTVFP